MKIQAPIEIEIKISITDNNGQEGVATLGITKGRYPTEEEIRAIVSKFDKELMPDGFRLMNKREWFNSVFGQCIDQDEDGEVTHLNWAMPGGESWDE